MLIAVAALVGLAVVESAARPGGSFQDSLTTSALDRPERMSPKHPVSS